MNVQELQAIAQQVQEAIEKPVDVKLQFGVLVIAVQSHSTNICAPIIEKLNQIKPNRMHVQVVGTGWNKMYKFTDGAYITGNSDVSAGLIVLVLLGGAIAWVVWSGITYKAPTPAPAIASDPNAGRVLLGLGPSGYELWADKTCVYVKGVRESRLRIASVDIPAYRKTVQDMTKYECVLFE